MQDIRGVQLGPYRLEREIAQSGGVRVFLATQTTLGRRAVVKVLSTEGADPTAIERFKREAATVARLRHPHIVTVHDYGEDSGVLYIATEFVDGGSLADRLVEPLPLVQVYLIISQVASALDYAHSRGVIHRNVKPANLLMAERAGAPQFGDRDYHPWVLLGDFSLAKVIDSSQITQQGVGLGTPYYMSPEQAQGRTVDKTTDIYSLAIVAFELLTFHVPFGGDTALEVAMKHVEQELPSVRQVMPSLPAQIDRVLGRAAAKRPQDRYQTAGDFADDLARAIGIEPAGREVLPVTGSDLRTTFGDSVGIDDEDDLAPPSQRPWLIPAIGGGVGLLVICVALVCAFNFVGPTVQAMVGLGPTPTATSIPEPTAITRTATPDPRATMTPTATPDPNKDENDVRAAVRQSNVIWAEAVGRNGTVTRLSEVYTGRWLEITTKQVNDLRANNQYREAQNLDYQFSNFRLNDAKDRATISTVERWNDTLRNSAGALINTNPPTVRQTYELVKQNGKWLVSDSQIERG